MTAARLVIVAVVVAATLVPVPVFGDDRPEPPAVTAAGAVLWDPADDRVLHGVAEDEPRPMASTTKMMTALLALEVGAGDDPVTVSERAAGVGGASVGLTPGQTLPVHDLLAGLLLHSGNDAAVAVAEHVAGSEPAFVDRMNARAAELGLDRTTFVNASGLTDDPRHAASPLDLARLAEEFMADDTLAELAGATSVDVPGLGSFPNRNELLATYRGATGVKTGFTSLAGQCLVASATRDGRTLYAVVLDSDGSFADAAALLDHGFGDFARAEPLPAGAAATRHRWPDAAVELVAEEPLAATVPVGADLAWRADVTPLSRPVDAGADAGRAVLLAGGEEVGQVPLRSAAAVPADRPREPAGRAGAALQETLRALAWTEPVERPLAAPGG